jgi:hypothetical protein
MDRAVRFRFCPGDIPPSHRKSSDLYVKVEASGLKWGLEDWNIKRQNCLS